MIVDFSKINMKESPTLLLKNADEHIIAPLMSVLKFKAQLYYNEISVLTFEVPKYYNGLAVEGYSSIQGLKIIEWKDVGKFVLCNPVTLDEGIIERKQCKAYSIEYEFNYKKISLENATYNFWNPVTPDSTILGIVLSYMPSWSVGTVDSSLVGKYRTFEINGTKLYDFMKNTLQETYSCIFEFDTLHRVVNVRDANNPANKTPVFISKNNLAKEIEIEEDTENIITVLDVNGAEGVTIRSVNPMGTNKIYNLDYFMNTENFSQSMIDKWNDWKTTYEANQELYYNISLNQSSQIARYNTEYAALTDMQGVLSSLEARQAVVIQAIAQELSKPEDLTAINEQIIVQQNVINTKKSQLESIKADIGSVTEQLKEINRKTAFSAFFNDDELVILDRYFLEETITDSSFVTSVSKSYTNADLFSDITGCTVTILGATIDVADYSSTKSFYSIRGGTIRINNSGFDLSASIIRGTLEWNTNKEAVFSCHLGNGTIKGEDFGSGNLSMTIDSAAVATTVDNMTVTSASANCYFTKNITEYMQRLVEWDLYEYGNEQLRAMSSPTYSFKVSSANFFALDEYRDFINQTSFGEKIYVETTMGVITPIVIGATLDYDKSESIELEFGSTFDINNATFDLIDLVSQSVSTAKSVDFSKYNYNKFVDSGAESSVREFMNSALDVAKNAILSSSGQAVTWDSSGIRLRKWKDESDGTYEPRQIWMANNSIMFTQDNWQSAAIAIGEFIDKNLGTCFGIVAPNIIGTLLAGENLVIESVKQDGGIAVFRVDGNGAFLHNADFNIVYGDTQITLNAQHGIGIGKYPLYTLDSDGNEVINGNNAKFWVDFEGNIHFKGTLEGANGKFSGELSAATGTFAGELKAATGSFKGELSAATGTFGGAITGGSINIGNGNFTVDSSGNLTAKSGTFSGTVQGATYKDSSGTDMMNNGKFKAGYLELKGLTITNKSNATTFKIDSNGNVTMSGNITLGSGSSINWANVTTTNDDKNPAYALANTANGTANTANTNAIAAINSANSASSAASAASTLAKMIANGSYSGGTFIDKMSIKSPTITAGTLYSSTIYSPKIYTNEFTIMAGVEDTTKSDAYFNFYGYYNGTLYELFRLSEGTSIGPYVQFQSPCSAEALWDFKNTTYSHNVEFGSSSNVYFNGTVDFDGADITGLNLTAKFG